MENGRAWYMFLRKNEEIQNLADFKRFKAFFPVLINWVRTDEKKTKFETFYNQPEFNKLDY